MPLERANRRDIIAISDGLGSEVDNVIDEEIGGVHRRIGEKAKCQNRLAYRFVKQLAVS
jgi:hypothetical protein